MPNNRLTALLLGSTLLSLSLCAQDPALLPAALQPEVAAAFKQVSPDSIRSVMSVLASDAFEGRQPGTRGFTRASEYVQDKLKAYGLKPGFGSSYIQSLLFKKGIVVATGSSLTLGDENLTYGNDFLLQPYYYAAASDVSAPLVFVGYGVYAPELKYDDYGSTDIKGKIVVLFDQAPVTFPSNERAYFSSPATKYAEAAKR
ncbi:MAG TPA: hypothetical protein VL832_10790, partial [Puia sp.]|nr:hypothetical protein [Puia sp.]